MKMFHAAMLGGAAAMMLSACAVDPAMQQPPVPDQPAALPPLQTSTPQPGEIAQCGHPGAAEAALRYPAGWNERLSKGATVSAYGGGDELLGGVSTVSEVEARDAQPIRPPQPVYPAQAARSGREGVCEALLDVSPEGRPQDILTACSSPEFNAPTYQAVTGLTFDPPREGGRSVRLVNVVYPVTYCLNGQ